MQLKVDNGGKRIDSYLIDKVSYSRSKIQDLIKGGHVLVNSNPIKSSYIVKDNDVIDVFEVPAEPMNVVPEKMDLDIVYEDQSVIVINKKNGVVVHPALGNNSGTLVNGLLYHSKNLSSINGEFRPGIVHRIDRDTTGLLMVAKNDKAHEFLAKQLEEEISDIEFDSPLSDDDAMTLCEWIDDRWGDICDPERIRWYEDD